MLVAVLRLVLRPVETPADEPALLDDPADAVLLVSDASQEFTAPEMAFLEQAAALCPTLEGGTERQRNPHAPGSLAWLSWVVARLGGWNCYGKPPGPKTMHDGWRRFAAIAEGHALVQTATHDACIP